jgi:thioredoxin 1
MPGNIINLTHRAEVISQIDARRNVIIYVTAKWCGPCKNMKPILNNYFEQIKDKFDMIVIDGDEGSDARNFLKINSYPTLISYVNSERTECLVGFDEEGLEHFIVSSYHAAVYN